MLTRKILLVKSVSPIVDDTHLSWMNTKHGNKRLWIPEVGCRCFPKDLAFSFVIQEIAWTILLCNLFLSSLRVCASLSSSSFSLSHEVTKEKKNCEAAAVTVWEAFPTTELSPSCPLIHVPHFLENLRWWLHHLPGHSRWAILEVGGRLD